jgi:hypothetical protein
MIYYSISNTRGGPRRCKSRSNSRSKRRKGDRERGRRQRKGDRTN